MLVPVPTGFFVCLKSPGPQADKKVTLNKLKIASRLAPSGRWGFFLGEYEYSPLNLAFIAPFGGCAVYYELDHAVVADRLYPHCGAFYGL